ncbi:uncharacterized protein LOC132047737 [Lycium ferocissimum]|uniref:uncharacterized protein LOC132047737 n=1 Tax=Lycium ferocissimum TaxID=112874 RepID=UPI002815DA45|nr:uncharacterized protein LOC132047737 [Lycium ferocissimum]
MRRIIIRGLKKEYIPFVTSFQGWAQQPSLEEFENLLSSRELLAKQMASVSIKEGAGNALVANKRNFKEIHERSYSREMIHSQFHEGSSLPRQKEEYSNNGKKTIKCYRCGEVGHKKRFCRAKESYMAQTERAPEEEDWGRCFVAETRVVDALASLNFERGWIVDSGYNTVHHVEKEDTGVINKKQENFENVQTGDVVAVTEEINEANPEAGNKSLDVRDVEVEPEQAVSETIYGNSDHSGESIEGVVVEVEVSGQSSDISESITSSDQILEADGEAGGQINEEVDLEGSISYGDTSSMIFGSSEAAKQLLRSWKGNVVVDPIFDNTIVKELRERGSLETQECEVQHEDDSRGSQRPKRNGGKSARCRDENFIKTYSCFFGGPIISEKPSSFEEGRSVGKTLLRSSPRHVQKLRLSSFATSSG